MARHILLPLALLSLALLAACNGARVSVFSSEKQDFYDQQVKREAPRACPNSCSNHGTCSGGTCDCHEGWTGEDCSIPLKTLSPNTPIRGQTVNYRSFNYYDVQVSGTGGLAFVVNATGNNAGDCDLFVKFGDFPTLHDYDQRDISVDQNVRIDVKLKGTGKYYLGVFGFTECHYDVEALVEGNDCPNGCSGHGTCIASTQTCNCNDGFAGDDCSYRIGRLVNNEFSSGDLETGEWNYYYYEMPSDYDAITFIVNQTSRTGDVDLYMKRDSLPTLTNWDHIDNSVAKNFALTLDDPIRGRWYVGLYAYQAVSYRIKPVLFQDCSNDCSGPAHGTCSANGCSCKSDFSGDYCQEMRPALSDGQKVNGFVDDNVWNYYHYRSTTVDSLLVSVNQTRDEDNPDCDVYVREGENPTFSDYDYRSIAFEDNVRITIEEGQFRTWFIGVFGFQACTYKVSVTPTTTCPGGGCSDHGTCLPDGTCRCEFGWGGEACDRAVTTVRSAQLITDTVGSGEWKYYVLSDVNASYFTTHMHEESTSGSIWLYVSEADFPTLERHDYIDRDSSSYHTLDVTTGIFPGEKDDFYIGVYGSPYLEEQQQASFKLEAWIPPF